MKAPARSYLWWPGLDRELEELAKVVKAVAPLHTWSWPTRSCALVHIDFAGRMFLVAVDANSKWPEVVEMSRTTATQTVAVLRKMFAANGLPEQLLSDNGPQFVSEEFASFCQFNGIKHIRVSLYHPSSNGLAERFVQTFKVAMHKSGKDGLSFSPHLSSFLLLYRATPRDLLPFHHLSCSWDVLSVPDWTCCAPIWEPRWSQTRHLRNSNMIAIANGTFCRLVSLFLFAISTEVLVRCLPPL